ncbi:MAG: hypothetical protein ACREJR_12355 [Candidatus Rokuibacteriota bacterium]
MSPVGLGDTATGDPSLVGAFRIDRDGVWHHEGVEVTHPGVLRNLYANLRRDGETYHLQTGPFRVPVDVADTPFVVVRAEVDRDAGTVEMHLTDGTRERLRPETLRLDADEVPRCRVKDGQFPARLSLAAWLQLAPSVELDPGSGHAILALGDRQFVLRGGERSGEDPTTPAP